MSASTLFAGMVFGAIGMGYLVYGKKEANPIALAAGMGLMVIPYFVPGVALMILAGAALVAAPFFIRL